MPLRVYRVCRAIHARLDGEGARHAGGRWNSAGRAVVYMAETISLAVLENLVHMAKEDYPTGYVVIRAVIPNTLRVLTEEDLAVQFGLVSRTELGDRWIDSLDSAVVKVRSAVVPFEHNYLFNPKHRDFEKIAVEPAVPFVFDDRLFKLRRS